MGSILKPNEAVVAGVSAAALVAVVYQGGVPPMAVVHATRPQDNNIEAGRRKAAYTAVGLVALMSLLTRDRTVFMIGGLAVIVFDWNARHANSVSTTGQLVSDTGYQGAETLPVAAQGDSYEAA